MREKKRRDLLSSLHLFSREKRWSEERGEERVREERRRGERRREGRGREGRGRERGGCWEMCVRGAGNTQTHQYAHPMAHPRPT